MSLFCCPCCGAPLQREEKQYRCPKGHSFDLAKAGYVNLLLPNQKGSKDPGDSKEMCRARQEFFAGDYYRCLKERLAQRVVELTEGWESPRVLDVGCGQGYYTQAMYEALTQAGKQPQMAGVDISKFALQYGAKNCRQVEYGVASGFHLPVADGGAQVVTDVFAPLCWPEFLRVIPKGGYLVLAVPGKDHLWGLKQAVYDKPYQNEEKEFSQEGFTLISREKVEDTITIRRPEDILALFHMTPYCWKTGKEGVARVEVMQELCTKVDFELHILKRD